MQDQQADLMGAGGEQGISDLGIRGAHVEFEAVRRFSDHLQAALQNANGEAVGGLRCQPQPEVLHAVLAVLAMAT